MKKIFLALFLFFSIWNKPLEASRMNDFISHLGNAHNFNAAGSYHEQSAGHYSAGGMMVRQRNKSVNLINIRLGEMGMACGDFDIRFGGLSLIKGEEFARMLKATAAGVPSYALQLALKTVSPQIEGTMSNIRAFLQKINGTMLNDCWARQQLLEGILPKGSALHEKVCQDMAQTGFRDDYTGARDRCMKGSEQDKALNAAKRKHKDLLVGEYNLVWNVLQKIPRYKRDNALSELILSLLGTIVSIKEGGGYKTLHIDPKIDEPGFLEAYLKGGETTALSCNERTKCLKVSKIQKIILPEGSLKSEVLKKLQGIQTKYLSETAFSTGEMNFLSDSVNLPLYKYIQVAAATQMEAGIARSTEYIALSLLLKQFEEVAAEILEAVSLLEAVQLDNTLILKFKKRLELARTRLHQKLQTLDHREMWMIQKFVKAKEHEMTGAFDLERGA